MEFAVHHLKAGINGMLVSGEYSDLTIKCQGSAYQVHKVIEGKTGIIDLSVDDPDAVKAMLLFLYKSNYKEMVKNKDEEPEEDLADSWLLHAKTYVLADKYDIAPLKNFTLKQFEHDGEDEYETWNPTDFAVAIEYIYEHTLPGNRAREIAVLTTLPKMDKLLHAVNGPFSKMMTKVGEFGRDVTRALRYCNAVDVSTNFASPTSYHNKQRVTDRRLKAYFCNYEYCQIIWRLDEARIKLQVWSMPICGICGDETNMEEFQESDYAMLYRFECSFCKGSIMSSTRDMYSNWQCCYCGNCGSFKEGT
ncbi:hypothetical protein FKW77_007021 [Venturia effusa]|uniref:BTB domain-containing protein n=1 Tax=Venturia effusa TaxID=50376 RepID=A0A517L1J6_9PEZI|nr:hypothetical protein FKW77_007021 [Venturia effusa]